MESVAQEVARFEIGMTLVEPGRARTEFHFGTAALKSTLGVLLNRIIEFEKQKELAASTDFPPGE